MNVLVLGYYGRKNLGDDIFEKVFYEYLKSRNFNPIIKNIDDVVIIPENIVCIIFGGGDLINDYFIGKINMLISNSSVYKNSKIPIYALGIGIPYVSLIDKGYMDNFDFIVSRSIADKTMMTNRYGPRYTYSPDMAFLLDSFCEPEKNRIKSPSKKIGIFLSRTIYNRNHPELYTSICETLRKFFHSILIREKKVFKFKSGLAKIPEYELHLFPFCTENKDDHDDRIINNDIYQPLKKFENLYLHNSAISVNEIGPLFSSFDLTICSRFHAHVFSIMAEVPFLSISTSQKVENLINETQTQQTYVKMDINPEFYFPTSLNINDCNKKFKYLEDHYSTIKTGLSDSNELYRKQVRKFSKKLDNLLFDLPIYVPNHLNFLINSKSKKIAEILSSNYTKDNFYFENVKDEFDVNKIVNLAGSIGKYFKNMDKNDIVELISYIIVGHKNSPYNHGLLEQIFNNNYCLISSISWIINHLYNERNIEKNPKILELNLNNKVPFQNRKLNLRNFSDEFKGYHRSGWNYVISNLIDYHNENGIIFDNYLDRTFGWDDHCLTFNQVIPYTSSWIGVFHHTYNPEYSMFDLSFSLENPNFIDSLPHCKGIIVLSKNNRKTVRKYLVKIGFSEIPVLNLFHPTELSNFDYFDINKFESERNKKIVQVGAWLRNTYAIYELQVPKNYMKMALKGKHMDNYFINDEEWIEIVKQLNKKKGNENASGHFVKGNFNNKYITGMIERIQKDRDSVILLSEINNDEYDKLLSKSIVFINLINAAAVNTLIECIVRNTPILVNRLPATEEYLGKDYPLFYDNMHEINELISDGKNIRNAYKYLKALDKNHFSINFFISSLFLSSLYKNI